ncbi:thiolase family protein [Bartonella sp. W8098]|uniref:thiolase family protein n=1 Tax=Bartonella TaxID=773 RepID=UPI0018DB99BA|nr:MULTISPECIES: thiolase family protein [Bartonella]MBH9986784.1 thiolase family protein [Bartonella apis]MBI0171166.1 thiolase family protein [Bartonella sp. W8151]
MDESRTPVIIAALRTPIARAYGALSSVDAEYLLSPLVQAIVERTNIKKTDIDDVMIGNAAGGGGNLARLAALTAGLPVEIPGVTIDRQCGSGLEAVVMACRLVEAGAGEIYLAGGAESVSTAPWRIKRPKTPRELPQFFSRARFSPKTIGDPDMGNMAENIARHFGISRQRQDRFALQSHQRALNAQADRRFDDEIIALQTAKGLFSSDDCPRAGLKLETLAHLRPAFEKNGTVTAGNSCPLNDGAALVLVTSLEKAKQLGIQYGIIFIDSAVSGIDPNLAGVGPVPSTKKLLQRMKLDNCSHFDVIEFNEAFAAQVLATIDALDISEEQINRDGGAIALGHPFGASGAILTTRLFSQMKNLSDDALGLATMGIGGGMGISAAFRPFHKA